MIAGLSVPMHNPSESMLSYLGLAQAGLWAAKVNDGAKTVLVVKLGTDTLKWIQRGVPVNMLIGHVQIKNALIRVIGLEVFDSKTNPLLPNLEGSAGLPKRHESWQDRIIYMRSAQDLISWAVQRLGH